MLRSVMIIDDNPRCLELMSLAISLTGLTDVRPELDAMGAMGRVRSDPPDLLLLDVKMPGIDGFGVIRTLRRDGALLPIVLCSGSALPAEVQKGYEEGCSGYVEKPSSLDGYRTLAHTICDYWNVNRRAADT
jgi:CheY-like chemotaxis protein